MKKEALCLLISFLSKFILHTNSNIVNIKIIIRLFSIRPSINPLHNLIVFYKRTLPNTNNSVYE